MNTERWVSVGQSTDSDSYTAGAEAATLAVGGRSAALLIVFCSDSHDLEQLLAGINHVSDGAPLIGCSTAGEIATAGPADLSVVITALGGEGFSIATAAASLDGDRLSEGGSDVASCLSRVEEREHRVLLLLTDGLAGDQQEIVRGAYTVAGAGIPLVGGCAGDDLKMTATAQLHGSEVLTNSVVAAAVASDGPLGIGVRHGWRRVGEPMVVTKSSDNRVYSLDGQPALDVYLSRLNAPADASVDASAFTRFAMTHPLGLVRRSQEEHVRFVADANFEDRSLGCIAEVPQGGMTWIMQGTTTPSSGRRIRPARTRSALSTGIARSVCSRSTASRGAASWETAAFAVRSPGSPTARTGHRSRASTPTERSPGRPASPDSTTRPSSSSP